MVCRADHAACGDGGEVVRLLRYPVVNAHALCVVALATGAGVGF